MSLVTPLNFNYQQLPQSIAARKYTRTFSPENSSTFSHGSTKIIRIPVRDNNYLDGANSYLKFKLKNLEAAAGPTLKLDPNGSAVIARTRILCGNTVMEDIDYSNVINNLLVQSQGSEDYNKALQILAHQDVADQDDTPNLIGKEIPGDEEVTICIPIFSGLLNCGKFLPLGLFATNSLTIELYLESDASVGVWSADPVNGYHISSVEYIASLIDVKDPNVNEALKMQMMTTGLEFHGQTYSTHINTITAGTGATLNIPERCKSLKGLITVVRPVDAIRGRQYQSLQVKYPHSTGGADFNWSYRIGSEQFPQKPIGSSAESFCEFQKLYNHLFSLDQSCYANVSRWNAPFATNANAGCFSMSVSTESFSHTNMMESGLDTAKGSVPVSLIISGMNLNGLDPQFLTFAFKDVIWRIDGTGQFQVSL